MIMIRNINTICVKPLASREIYCQNLIFVKKSQKSPKEAKFRDNSLINDIVCHTSFDKLFEAQRGNLCNRKKHLVWYPGLQV